MMLSTTTFKYLSFSLLILTALSACTGMPDGVEPVTGFDKSRYLGTWHEIARLDHSFERDLVDVKAEYSLRDDGAVRVINSGTDSETGERKVAEGHAKFVGDDGTAHLKVSFFGPFYGSYIVFELDPDYRYAFVAGYNTNYLWLLARETNISEDIRKRFTDRAGDLGFAVNDLVWLH
ncbi:lipocalin family protein [Luminiphilus sp.]|nr:lipocalin family protein [Luminiphilus sp.]MDA8826450.1 lipocalin family protein [Luminiphilus sp.]MDA9581223.1 lipocalin family protein [Luminiphilus sp.]MDB2353010.1 lipocalin family protein [Luminiphilus sp.]MDB2616443.1 lipocalin family protein [Luminiphilus sp.]